MLLSDALFDNYLKPWPANLPENSLKLRPAFRCFVVRKCTTQEITKYHKHCQLRSRLKANAKLGWLLPAEAN